MNKLTSTLTLAVLLIATAALAPDAVRVEPRPVPVRSVLPKALGVLSDRVTPDTPPRALCSPAPPPPPVAVPPSSTHI